MTKQLFLKIGWSGIRISFSRKHDKIKNLFNLSIFNRYAEFFLATSTNHMPHVSVRRLNKK